MDMCLSEAGMFECENGHTCCESHQLETEEISTDDKRKRLISEVEDNSYYQTRQREKAVELDEIANLDDSEVDDKYEDTVSDSGHAAQECPVCMFQKIDQGLVFQYLLKKHSTTVPELLAELKGKFTTYVEFKKFVDGK